MSDEATAGPVIGPAPDAFDVVIVGGGSSGCVLANRLSADPRRRVLLIEAGRDIKPGEEAPAMLDIYPGRVAFDPVNHWPALPAYFRPVAHNAAERPPLGRYEQPRLMGGGSSINGQVANRGTPDDYDEWERLGATGWNWQSVLPYFKKLERDLDYGGPLHGDSGPIPIHRVPRERWPAFSLAAEAALEEAGFPALGDQNGRFEDGHFPMTLSNDGVHRVSTARAYLDRETRQRPNLVVMANTSVSGLAWDGRRVVGVQLRAADGVMRSIGARETIVAAGAIHSPALLMKSGIGPAPDLHRLGVTLVHDLPGVGRNLQEHPGISLSAYLARAARLRGTTRRHIHLGLRYSSGSAEGMPSDMYMMVVAKSAWHPLGRQIATLLSWINKPYARGSVTLQGADPAMPPLAAFNHLADIRDVTRLTASVRFMARLLACETLAGHVAHASPSRYSGFAKALGRYSLRNFLITAPAAVALDALPFLRAPFFRHFVAGGMSLADLLASDEAIAAYVRDNAFGQWHACGTCRMGSAGDREAVTDPASGRVHGVSGLRVIDASVMPTAPRANLNIPVIMLAERLADAILATGD
ncbi:5-(hydroxymethyl)furfural oxidase [Hyphomicrobiales bacterium]|nr:5-(hydroxymethyl)furfural oxidase [Hyphomicrobiales bacterium]CAH1674269.1 5-(hydroxymethyl)furfural oxidase [Hyphomicrobiales bacterium]